MSHLSLLQSRKQLLIAESELNRIQLSEEWRTMAHGARDLAHQAKTVGAWVSAAALLVAGLVTRRSGPPTLGAVKSSWFQRILSGARLASTIWLAFRALGEKEHPK